MAACSRRASMPPNRAFTVTTTNEMQNSTWEITRVKNPSALSAPADTNMARREAPITTSGVAIGRKMIRFEVARPRKVCRTRANAIKVPRTVAMIVDVRLTLKLSTRESHNPSGSQIDVQLRQVKDSNWAVAERPEGWLNDSAKMYPMGTN